MQHQQISLPQFAESLQVVINQSIWRVIHPADGWLFLDIGQQYQDSIFNSGGTEQPYTKGKFQLHIKGDWTISRNEIVIESRTVKSGETQENYFARMEAIVQNFPMKSICSVNVNYGEVVFAAKNGYELKVMMTDHDDSLSLTVVELSNFSVPVAYTYFRHDEELKSLVTVSSQA